MSVKIAQMTYKAGGGTAIKKSGAASPRLGSPGDRSVARLSHDIRTQLYIIIGFAELMLEEIPGKINQEQRRNLSDVLNSGRRLQELLRDIVAGLKTSETVVNDKENTGRR